MRSPVASVVADATWRILAVCGHDAILQQRDRIAFARRSYPRLIVAVLYLGSCPFGALAAPADGRIAFFVVALAASVAFGWMIIEGIAPFGYRYPMLTIDTRARVLLNARSQMVAPLSDVQLIDDARGGLLVKWPDGELHVMHGPGASEDALTVLRAHGIDVVRR